MSDKLGFSQFFELFPAALEEIESNFGDISLLEDDGTKELVRGFLVGVYRNFTDTIKEIDSALALMSNSVDYKNLKLVMEKLKEFLEKYKKIFVAAGINEDEVKNKIKLLKEKEAALSQFLTH